MAHANGPTPGISTRGTQAAVNCVHLCVIMIDSIDAAVESWAKHFFVRQNSPRADFTSPMQAAAAGRFTHKWGP